MNLDLINRWISETAYHFDRDKLGERMISEAAMDLKVIARAKLPDDKGAPRELVLVREEGRDPYAVYARNLSLRGGDGEATRFPSHIEAIWYFAFCFLLGHGVPEWAIRPPDAPENAQDTTA